jgi:hypothetical protein
VVDIWLINQNEPCGYSKDRHRRHKLDRPRHATAS